MKIKLSAVLLVCYFLLVSAACYGKALAAPDNLDLKLRSARSPPDFHANYQVIDSASDQVIASFRVTVSRHEVVIRQLPLSQGLSMVIAWRRHQVMLVDRVRRLYFPLTASQLGPVYQGPTHHVGWHSRVNELLADEFVQRDPCLRMERRYLGEAVINARSLEKWQCLYQGKIIETQWFDPMSSLVIRSVSFDGYTVQFVDLRIMSNRVAEYVLPGNFEKVNASTFFSRTELKNYQ